MKSEEERILHIRVKYEDAINSIAKYKESIDALKNAEKELGQQVKDGTITEKEYKTQVAAIGEQVKQYKENIRVLSKEIQNNLIIRHGPSQITEDAKDDIAAVCVAHHAHKCQELMG